MRTPVYIEHLVPDNTLPNHSKLYIDIKSQHKPKIVSNLNYIDSFQSKKVTTNITEDITTTTTTIDVIKKQPLFSPRVQPLSSPRTQLLTSPRTPGRTSSFNNVQEPVHSIIPGRHSSFSNSQNNYEPYNRQKMSSQNSSHRKSPVISVSPTSNEQLKEFNISGQKQIQILNLANQLDNRLRKDFIKKQQQLRRQPSRGEDTEVDIDSQALNTNRNFDDVKLKPTIVNHSNSINQKTKHPSTNNNCLNNNPSGHRQVVINFEKYKVENQTNESHKEKVNDKKMVSKPAPPRKHHTFNENQSTYHKDAKNKLVLNLNQNKKENQTKPNVDIIYFKKPITRTGSTLITENTKNLKGRRPPKEFLPDKVNSPRDLIDQRQTPNGRTTSRESFYSKESYIKEENFNNDHSNRTLSPATMKSLPTYDEALKRVFSDTQSTKKIPAQQSIYTKSLSNASKSVDINTNGSYTSLLLKNKSTLPNLSHTQSNFKSLLQSVPNITHATNSMTSTTNQGSRVYFRPQDLSAANRLIQLNQSSSIALANVIENAKAENELYLLQKNSIENNNQTGSSNKIIIKKLASSSPSILSNKQESDAAKNTANSGAHMLTSVPAIENGTTRQTTSTDLKNVNSNLPNLIPIQSNPNTPIINNYDFTNSSTKTTNHPNYVTVTKTTEQIQNTVIPKPSSPVNGFYPLVSSSSSADAINSTNFLSSMTTNPISNSSSTNNFNQRLKSWNNVNNYEMSNLRSPRVENMDHNTILLNKINVRERTPTPDRFLNNRKPTAYSNNEREINTNYSHHYEEELFSPRHNLNRAASEQRMAAMEKSQQEIEIQLSPGKLVDAVKAATNTNGSTESGLALINEFNKNTQALIGEFNKNNIPRSGLKSQLSNYTDTRYIDDTNSYPAQMCSTIRTNNNTKTMSNRKQHSLDDTFSVSTSSFSESESINNNNKNINKKRASSNEFIEHDRNNINGNNFNSNDNLKNDVNDHNQNKFREEDYFLDEISTMNELPSLPAHKLKNKKCYSVGNNLNSLTSGSSDNKRRLNKINSEENILQKRNYMKQISNISKDEASGCRPRGRLNFYDSDTFSENFLINGSPSTAKANRKNFINNDIILSDSPGLSDLSEDLNGGHRTSTPNMSKKRIGSAPELNFIRKQIEDLEKMYLEIKKIVDPERMDNYSKTLDDTSTFSSSESSNFKSSNKKVIGARSSSVQRAQRNEEISHLKHRFVRMENNLVQLAKTVAQISVELKSMKTVENVIKNLTRDVHELQKLNLGLSNSSTKPGDLCRSASEPRQLATSSSKDKLDESNSDTAESNSNNKICDLVSKRKSSKDSANTVIIPNYTNPRKLKKLTKFFGQEPPMLRLFLQKLNYEVYASNFENEHITITELPYLSEERLKMLGIPLGPRLRILQEAQLSFRRENSTKY